MRILDKIAAKQKDLYGQKSITIVFLGDSVTQGCFECFEQDGVVDTVFDTENSYSAKLKKILNYLYPSVQVNIINSGISGDSAAGGLKRFERDVAAYNPDLTVVGFALNDCCVGGAEQVGAYKQTLKTIIEKVKALGSECVMLTPNMMVTRSYEFSSKAISDISVGFANLQNGGVLDLYAEAARQAARESDVKLADVYAKWKQMSKNGVNTDALLANKLNHPQRDVHWMTAFVLMQTLFED